MAWHGKTRHGSIDHTAVPNLNGLRPSLICFEIERERENGGYGCGDRVLYRTDAKRGEPSRSWESSCEALVSFV